ncbi:Protein of unknown function [Bizionia echini]|uniref:DUF2975 domain-containing protein n=1 Tax=Bizionia echini TaxID=649333 RepID=A0A1I4Z3K3_9FLAO|nr:hypothetical protein [Bizionia echini]SFN44778.1 Protein of unknown function [Bizionia echini]
MRKLMILKSVIDFIWILSCIPILILGFAFSIYMFFNTEILELTRFTGFEIEAPVWQKQLFIILGYSIVCGFIYVIFLFRKTLRLFQQRRPFDSYVIETYNKMGKVLIGLSIASMIGVFILRIVFTSKIEFTLGLSPYLLIMSLGLFFMVLSESFKIAKQAQQDSELSI